METFDGKWHSHVEIDRQWYKVLQAWFLDTAIRRSAEKVAFDFYRCPFEPYAPVRRQLLGCCAVSMRPENGQANRCCHMLCLPMRRRVVRPFEANPAAGG